MNTITNTIAVVTVVSLRVGQVTRANSWRTCWTNSAALVLAMSDQITLIGHGRSHHHTRYIETAAPRGEAPHREGFPANRVDPLPARRAWQEWRGSNPQPPVLETGALPVELHSYLSSMTARSYLLSPRRPQGNSHAA